jgi:hypothetical protein
LEPYRDFLDFKILVKHVPTVSIFRSRIHPTECFYADMYIMFYCVVSMLLPCDRLCGLVVRVHSCGSRGPGFDSRHYQILRVVMVLERDTLSPVSTNEELLERNISGWGLETREYGHEDPLRWLRDTICPQKLPLISSTSGGRLVGMIHSRTKATELWNIYFSMWRLTATIFNFEVEFFFL